MSIARTFQLGGCPGPTVTPMMALVATPEMLGERKKSVPRCRLATPQGQAISTTALGLRPDRFRLWDTSGCGRWRPARLARCGDTPHQATPARGNDGG